MRKPEDDRPGKWADLDAHQRNQLDRFGIQLGIGAHQTAQFEAAVKRVEDHCNQPVEVRPDDAARGPGWWVVPFGWIGCVGHLVPDDGPVEALGSGLTTFEWLWALSNGLPIDIGTFGVLITAVHNPEEGGRVLSRRYSGYGSRWMRMAQSEPVQFEADWMNVRGLIEIERNHYFDFELVPLATESR